MLNKKRKIIGALFLGSLLAPLTNAQQNTEKEGLDVYLTGSIDTGVIYNNKTTKYKNPDPLFKNSKILDENFSEGYTGGDVGLNLRYTTQNSESFLRFRRYIPHNYTDGVGYNRVTIINEATLSDDFNVELFLENEYNNALDSKVAKNRSNYVKLNFNKLYIKAGFYQSYTKQDNYYDNWFASSFAQNNSYVSNGLRLPTVELGYSFVDGLTNALLLRVYSADTGFYNRGDKVVSYGFGDDIFDLFGLKVAHSNPDLQEIINQNANVVSLSLDNNYSTDELNLDFTLGYAVVSFDKQDIAKNRDSDKYGIRDYIFTIEGANNRLGNTHGLPVSANSLGNIGNFMTEFLADYTIDLGNDSELKPFFQTYYKALSFGITGAVNPNDESIGKPDGSESLGFAGSEGDLKSTKMAGLIGVAYSFGSNISHNLIVDAGFSSHKIEYPEFFKGQDIKSLETNIISADLIYYAELDENIGLEFGYGFQQIVKDAKNYGGSTRSNISGEKDLLNSQVSHNYFDNQKEHQVSFSVSYSFSSNPADSADESRLDKEASNSKANDSDN